MLTDLTSAILGKYIYGMALYVQKCYTCDDPRTTIIISCCSLEVVVYPKISFVLFMIYRFGLVYGV